MTIEVEVIYEGPVKYTKYLKNVLERYLIKGTPVKRSNFNLMGYELTNLDTGLTKEIMFIVYTVAKGTKIVFAHEKEM
tara:strand:- start:429 stop:662 length:234 start_codon:yes stop_codon:yes gene_type:complete